METPPCSAVLGASELCTSIIEFIHDSSHDLRSCALASRQFTFPAQSHLFRFVNLDIRISQEANIVAYPGSQSRLVTLNINGSHNTRRTIEAAARLSKIMEGAPHLRLLVRTLHTRVDEAVLAHIVKMRLTRLARLSLEGTMFSEASRSAARDLMAIPSVKWLTLSTGFTTCGELKFLFSRRTAPLRTLDMLHFNVQRSANEPLDPATPLAQRTQISNLLLSRHCSETAECFIAADSPIDFSQLQRIGIYDSPGTAVLAILPPARKTIQELRVHAQDISLGRPLAYFPALKTLRLIGDPPTLLAALATLPAQSDHLEVITLAARGPVINMAVLKPIDTLLAGLHLPALTRVEVSVSRFYQIPQDSSRQTYVDYDHSAVVPAFSAMHARGVLVVQHDDVWGVELAERFKI
ncbi:hypothetical protein B0H19DRAFT_1370381 [Mycena capillaripes]|nr:hypothetical protein B0H19DRAFT_1370381 [Mycena capillaripes]